MGEFVFLKLGGSLITDKQREATARPDVIRRAAQEVARALRAEPELVLLMGHGSGSFGHAVAQQYGTRMGAVDPAGWRGYAETGAAAARLNRLVVDIFLSEGVPVVTMQPSASALCSGGELLRMEVGPIETTLKYGLIPLVYGDVAIDDIRGCTIISTEQIFAYLALMLRPDRIVLAGEVDGVFDSDPLRAPQARRFDAITPDNIEQVRRALSGSHGLDVTGGMLSKVNDMYTLTRGLRSLRVHFVSGAQPGAVERTLTEPEAAGGTVLYTPSNP